MERTVIGIRHCCVAGRCLAVCFVIRHRRGAEQPDRAARLCVDEHPYAPVNRIWRDSGGTLPPPERGEVVDKRNKEINAALADPKIKTQLTDLGGTSLALSPDEFGKLIADDTDKWGKVIRAANIKPE